MFIHRLATDKDIIINDDSNFTYNEHINLAKKILKSSNLKKLGLVKKRQIKKNHNFHHQNLYF